MNNLMQTSILNLWASQITIEMKGQFTKKCLFTKKFRDETNDYLHNQLIANRTGGGFQYYFFAYLK